MDWNPATPALMPLGVKLLLLTGALEGLREEEVLAATLDETRAVDVAEAAGADAGLLEAGAEDTA